MSERDIPNTVKDFVFRSIDSAEQLEILLLLFSDKQRAVSVKELSDLLRSSPGSIEKRMKTLVEQELVMTTGDGSARYRFNFENHNAVEVIDQLVEVYKTHRYGILEIIFSPLKKSRDFADAFKFSGSKGGHND
jgi:predicted transcriptional regulator